MPVLLALRCLCLVCLALNPHTLVVVDAKHRKLFIAVAEKEASLLAERANSSFLLLLEMISGLSSNTAVLYMCFPGRAPLLQPLHQ